MKASQWIRTGALFGLLAIVFGAFGAHALKAHLTPYQLDIWNKAVLYQMIHALAICFIGLLILFTTENILNNAGWLFTAGIISFSGSLYILATADLMGINAKWAGPVTPLGGICFIGGWILLSLTKVKSKKEN